MHSPSSQSKPRILLVDDNPAIHDDYMKILVCNPNEESASLTEDRMFVFGDSQPKPNWIDFEVDSAYQGQEALVLVEKAVQAGRPYALAFVDIRMPPGWDGLETISQLWMICPDLQIVICTAYSDFSWNDINARAGCSDKLLILKKPFDNIEVLQLARTLTEKWALTNQRKKQLADLDHLVEMRTAELQNANEQLRIQMANQSRLEEQLRQKHKLEAVGRLSAGIAHEFNNLLMIITGFIDVLQLDTQFNGEAKELLNGIKNASTRASKLVQQLLAFSGKQFLRPQTLVMKEVLNSLSSLLSNTLGDHIRLSISESPKAPAIWGDSGLLSQVIMNLVLNARDAMPGGGQIMIELDFAEILEIPANPEARAGRFLLLTIRDTGAGIQPEDMPYIFEPFYTTKDVGKGTGMGLAAVFGIVKQHAGWIEVQSVPGQGAVFQLYFPAFEAFQEPASKSLSDKHVLPSLLPKTCHTILVVDDEPLLRRMIRLLLNKDGYTLIETGSAEEALSIWPEIRNTVDLLITDVVMPGMHGHELAQCLIKDKPELKIIFCSGYSPEIAGGTLTLREGDYFIQKPDVSNILNKVVRECLQRHSSSI